MRPTRFTAPHLFPSFIWAAPPKIERAWTSFVVWHQQADGFSARHCRAHRLWTMRLLTASQRERAIFVGRWSRHTWLLLGTRGSLSSEMTEAPGRAEERPS